MLRTLQRQFLALIGAGVATFLIYIGPYVSTCLLQKNNSAHEAASKEKQPNKFQGVIDTPMGPMFVYPRTEASQAKPENAANTADNSGNSKPALCETKPTDALLVLFTYCLVIVGWITVKSGAQIAKTTERAYLSPVFDKAFVEGSDDLEVFHRVRNDGRTSAIAFEVYGEIADSFPDKVSYPNKTRIMRLNRGIAAGAIDPLGSVFANIKGSVVFGYVKYRDIFGDEHTTGFAARYNKERMLWETDGEDLSPWFYWT